MHVPNATLLVYELGADMHPVEGGGTYLRYPNCQRLPKSLEGRALADFLRVDAAGDHEALAEQWNGATWRRLLPIYDPSRAFNDLDAISCPAVYRCIAVGGTGVQRTLAYLWNGTRWLRLRTA
jgi:hypothetical protein